MCDGVWGLVGVCGEVFGLGDGVGFGGVVWVGVWVGEVVDGGGWVECWCVGGVVVGV